MRGACVKHLQTSPSILHSITNPAAHSHFKCSVEPLTAVEDREEDVQLDTMLDLRTRDNKSTFKLDGHAIFPFVSLTPLSNLGSL